MDKLKLTAVMIIWGSIGIFTRYIDLSPIILAFFRAIIALPVLIIFIKYKKISLKIPFNSIKSYILAGVLLGLGWTALFYGYKNTSISNAVIIYNMCPIYIMLMAPIFLKEKLTRTSAIIILLSFIGLFFVVGIKTPKSNEFLGILLSWLSGICYAIIVIINRKSKSKIDSTLATMVQIATANIILIAFVIIEGDYSKIAHLNAQGLIFVIILGVVHTGVAYSLYFSTYQKMKSIDIVSFSYLEPLFGILLSVLLLNETLSISQIIGGLLILGSTYIGEYIKLRKQKIKIHANAEDM